MDAPTHSTDSSSGHEPGKKLVVSDGVTYLPNHQGKVVHTFNGSHTMDSHNSGSGGATATSGTTNNNSNAISVPAFNSGPGVSKGLLGAATMHPSSNSVIQTPLMNSQTALSPATTGATVTLVRPPMQTTGPLVNNASSAGSHIIKAEPPTTIIQTAPQPAVTPGVVSSPRFPTTGAPGPGLIRAFTPQMLAPRLQQTSPGQPSVHNIQLPPGMVLAWHHGPPHQQVYLLFRLLETPSSADKWLPAPSSARGVRPQHPLCDHHSSQTPCPSEFSWGYSNRNDPQDRQPVSWEPACPDISEQSELSDRRELDVRAYSKQLQIDNSGRRWRMKKKCKNFLSTLIKLASTGKQSTETAQRIKPPSGKKFRIVNQPATRPAIVQRAQLLPQPYLVPFLKRSLPALRQLTPDSAAFIRLSQLPVPACSMVPSTSPVPTSVVLGSPSPRLMTPVSRPQLQTGISKPGPAPSLVIQPQQQRTMLRPQVALATPTMVAHRNQAPGRIMLGQQHAQLQPVPVKTEGSPFPRQVSAAALTLAQRNKLREAGGLFKDDDDINDVASMAGVNLSEESANILATNSGLVGAVTRSCKDEAFLSCALLQRRMMEIGRKYAAATDPAGESVPSSPAESYSIKEDDSYEQSSDVRAQLKFFEQLDQQEKQRKEEQEREILLKAAKSRARQEDPEQLLLKQKAKEMQQQELAQVRQREANLTALAAIGPRKKRKLLDSQSSSAAAEGSGSGPSLSGGASGSRPTRQRITRVNLRDLLFCLENERFSSHSHFLYKGFLK
ncbi:hypothetical protein KUCAC02_029971 [Chaenocephalus aceratus]|uniref:Uncharacterized protein n=1 Tax=Chaenocephalus aceratus TaxID=36190 RepID=A0ACB9XHE2_CHAAC|nr:hypothetical protein KUCAC02_029971 [Chaenocephalus aceratus]